MRDDIGSDLQALGATYALQEFGFKLAHVMKDLQGQTKAGDDVMPYLKRAGVEPPAILGDGPLIQEEPAAPGYGSGGPAMVFVGPGDPTALGMIIGCYRPKGKEWKYCLECGWFYCKIVIHLPPIVVETPVP